MPERRPFKIKIYTRAVVAIILITIWTLVALTGLLLWLAPAGSGSGKQILIFEMTKSWWGEAHFWIAVGTFVVTVIHIIIDWKALRSVIKYLVSVHRGTEPILK